MNWVKFILSFYQKFQKLIRRAAQFFGDDLLVSLIWIPDSDSAIVCYSIRKIIQGKIWVRIEN